MCNLSVNNRRLHWNKKKQTFITYTMHGAWFIFIMLSKRRARKGRSVGTKSASLFDWQTKLANVDWLGVASMVFFWFFFLLINVCIWKNTEIISLIYILSLTVSSEMKKIPAYFVTVHSLCVSFLSNGLEKKNCIVA